MPKRRQKSLNRDLANHRIEAKNPHFEESMEIANEFFDQSFVRPMDRESLYADELTRNLENDFKKTH